MVVPRTFMFVRLTLGAPIDYSTRLGVRTYGGHPDGEAMVVSGTYQLEGDVSRRLLAALPSILVILILAEVRGKRQLIKGPLR